MRYELPSYSSSGQWIKRTSTTLAFTSIILLTLSLTSPFSYAENENVILLMLDGVRWQEVFLGTDPELSQQRTPEPIFKNLLGNLSSQGVLLGNLQNDLGMELSNWMMISMPAYQSILAGSPQCGCFTNDCGRIGVETVQERVKNELGLTREQVLSISSWRKMNDAVEKHAGSTLANAGIEPFLDPEPDLELEELNQLQTLDRPEWPDARWDKYTFAHALRYLKKHQPRFLYISLNDSDEWAHHGNYHQYVETLRTYDQWIQQLIDILDALGEYGEKTTLLVSTDHGRGLGSNWRHHIFILPESKYVWLYGRSPKTRSMGAIPRKGYTHLDIRPTIEASLGLAPKQCPECGKVIEEIASPKTSL